MIADECAEAGPMAAIREAWRRASLLPRGAQLAVLVVSFVGSRVLRSVWDIGESDAVGIEHAVRWWLPNLAVFLAVWVSATLVVGLLWHQRTGSEPGSAVGPDA